MEFPNSSEVANAIETAETQGGEASPDLAPEGQQAAPTITELDKLEKFKFENQEYTPEELKKAMLRQADYTRKTQEFSQERKFYDNLSADLRSVRANPALVQEFKRIYPEKFHSYLEYVSGGTQNTPQPAQSQGSNQTAYQGLDPKIIEEFTGLKTTVEQLQNERFNQQVQSIETSLEAQEKTLGAKYPMADLESVYSKAQAILDNNSNLPKDEHVKLTAETWEKIYKADHDKQKARYESFYKENINKQKQANLRAKDSGLGGSTPGSAPAKYKSIREATSAALNELDS